MELLNIEKMVYKVRNGTQEIIDTYLHEEDIISMLDDGLVDASAIIGIKYLNYISEEFTEDLIAGQYIYSIPDNALDERVEALRILYNNEYYELKEMMVDQEVHLLNLNTDVVPKYYIVKSSEVQIYPTPTSSITNGLIWVYPKKLIGLDKQLGKITSIELNSRMYFDNFNYVDTEGLPRVNINDYITVIDKNTGVDKYHYRVATINTTDSYIEIYKGGLSSLITNVSLGGNYFEVTDDISNIVFGDTFTITGSTDNDGTYTIIGVDVTNKRVHVRETIPGATVDGTATFMLPTEYDGKTISSSLLNLDYMDYVMPFNKTAFVRMPRAVQDYIVAYAIKKVFDKAQEPNTEALQNLQRLAQILEDTAADRKAQIRFKYRGTF